MWGEWVRLPDSVEGVFERIQEDKVKTIREEEHQERLEYIAREEKRIAENRNVNPADLETERLALALAVLTPNAGNEKQADAGQAPADALLSLRLGEVSAGRGDYAKSLDWFRKAVEQAPTNSEALKGALLGELSGGDTGLYLA